MRPHCVAIDVDWAEGYSHMLSWDTEWCDCDRPWRHGREYLGCADDEVSP